MASNHEIYVIGDEESQQSVSPLDEDNSSDQPLRFDTLEKPPNIDHYRKTVMNNSGMSARASITQLLNGTLDDRAVALQLGDKMVMQQEN